MKRVLLSPLWKQQIKIFANFDQNWKAHNPFSPLQPNFAVYLSVKTSFFKIHRQQIPWICGDLSFILPNSWKCLNILAEEGNRAKKSTKKKLSWPFGAKTLSWFLWDTKFPICYDSQNGTEDLICKEHSIEISLESVKTMVYFLLNT